MPIRTALSLLRAAFIAALTATVLPMTAHAAAGDPLGPDFRVDSGAGTGVLSPAMARDSIGNGVVVWERLGSSAPGIHARRYGADGSTQGVEFAVPLADGIPAVAMAPAGDFVVSSSSYDAVAGRYRIQFQLYAADGSTRGAATEVASYSKPARGLIANLPAPVAMDADGNFTVIWNQASVSNIGGGFGPTYLSTSTNVIHGRSYGADGVARGAAFLVHADLPDIVPLNGAPGLGIPALAMDAEGNFITAWINHNIRSNIVEYKRYNAAGKAQGLMQRANAISMKLPFAASIAADPMGGFVIVWAERDGDSSEPAQVWVQRYSRAGTALGAPLAANSPTADLVQAPSVGVQPGGGFVVAWTRYSLAVDSWTIAAQRFASGGTARGGNFQVNSQAPGYQRNPAVAVDGYGDFAIAWAQGAQLGNAFDGIYLRLYHGN